MKFARPPLERSAAGQRDAFLQTHCVQPSLGKGHGSRLRKRLYSNLVRRKHPVTKSWMKSQTCWMRDGQEPGVLQDQFIVGAVRTRTPRRTVKRTSLMMYRDLTRRSVSSPFTGLRFLFIEFDLTLLPGSMADDRTPEAVRLARGYGNLSVRVCITLDNPCTLC